MAYFLSNYDDQFPRFQVLYIYKTSDCFAFTSRFYYQIEENLKTDLVLNGFI